MAEHARRLAERQLHSRVLVDGKSICLERAQSGCGRGRYPVPEGSVPDLTTTLSYEAHLGRKVRITPSLSYQTGYPYGNGTELYIIGPNKKPELVPNDNFTNPGYNYYFLRESGPTVQLADQPVRRNAWNPRGTVAELAALDAADARQPARRGRSRRRG